MKRLFVLFALLLPTAVAVSCAQGGGSYPFGQGGDGASAGAGGTGGTDGVGGTGAMTSASSSSASSSSASSSSSSAASSSASSSSAAAGGGCDQFGCLSMCIAQGGFGQCMGNQCVCQGADGGGFPSFDAGFDLDGGFPGFDAGFP